MMRTDKEIKADIAFRPDTPVDENGLPAILTDVATHRDKVFLELLLDIRNLLTGYEGAELP